MLALTIPAITLGVSEWYSNSGFGDYKRVDSRGYVVHSRAGMGMMGGMMGSSMMGDHESGEHMEDEGVGVEDGESRSGEDYKVEEVTITGVVEESFHMMLEVETREYGEVEVMVPHWWKVTFPNGETVEVSGWELVEEYIDEGDSIVVKGYLYEMPAHCMMEGREPHLTAYLIELPELGITAEILS